MRRFAAEIERVKAHFPKAKRVGLADGAESNWQFLTQHIQIHILDYYHASSYLGAVANAKYPKDKSAHKAWLEDRCHQLKNTAGAAEALYNEMVALQARKSTQKLPQHLRDKLGAAVTYYKNHRHQMNYISYTDQYLPIGSGVTEAAYKTEILFCRDALETTGCCRHFKFTGISFNCSKMDTVLAKNKSLWRSFCCGCFKLRLHPLIMIPALAIISTQLSTNSGFIPTHVFGYLIK